MNPNRLPLRGLCVAVVPGCAAMLSNFICIDDAHSASRFFRPSLNITQSYSDNVNLLPKESEQSAFVTEINPGISFYRQGARTQLSADFRMQNIIYAGSDNRNRTLFQGQANGNLELIKNSVYMDLALNHSQQNQSNVGRIARDNIAQNNNRSDITTFSVSPYWTPHLGGYVDGQVRLRYAEVNSSGALGDSRLFEERVNLVSGHDFSRVTWRFDFLNQEQNRSRSDQDDPRFQNTEAEVRYRFSRRYSVFARAGHNNSDFSGNQNSNRNGVYAALGAAWQPNRYFALEAAAGNNWYVRADVIPSARTSWSTTYQHNDIGTNIGNRWSTLFSHQTRNTVWNASYSEDTITAQQVLLDLNVFNNTDPFGASVANPVAEQSLQLFTNLPTLRNEVFIRKRGSVSFSWRAAKNTLSLTAFRERRDFQASGDQEDATGVDGVWFNQISRQVRSTVRAGWQGIEFDSQRNTDERLWLVSLRVDRRISDYFNIAEYIDGFLEYRFSSQNSDRALNEYVENRISAGVNINF